MVQALPAAGTRGHDAGRGGLAGQLERDARRENVAPALAWTVAALPLVGLAALLAAAVVFRPAYDRILQEDYPVEWAQFALCLFVSLTSLLAAWHAGRRGQYLVALTLLLLGLGTFVLSGEEISWGQRVFGLATPAELQGRNAQSELNLHNITTGFDPEAAFRFVALAIGLAGTILPLLTRLEVPLLRGAFWRLLSPPLFTVPLFAMMLGYRAYRLVVAGEVNFAVRLQEWIEFCQYLGLAITLVGVYFTVCPPREPVIGPGRHAHRPPWLRDFGVLIPIASTIVFLTLVFAALTLVSGVGAGNAL
jgi:hypothetical protein